MPRDDWARAKAKDAARRRVRPTKMSGKAKAASIRRLASPETKLWFGKHKGRKVREIPRDYLLWLLNTESDRKHWRMEALKGFLRGYVEK